MDAYTRIQHSEERYKSMAPEERLRWHYENDCTCHVVEGWWEPANHFMGCPLENPECDMWNFFWGVDEGFVSPK